MYAAKTLQRRSSRPITSLPLPPLSMCSPFPRTTGSHNVLSRSGLQGVTQTHPHFCAVTKIEGQSWDQRPDAAAAAAASSLHMSGRVTNSSQSLQRDVSPASFPPSVQHSPLHTQLFLLARQGDRRSARSRVKPCCNLTTHSSLVLRGMLEPRRPSTGSWVYLNKSVKNRKKVP